MSGEENDFYRFDDFSLDAALKVLQHHLYAQLSALGQCPFLRNSPRI